jgi:hypothetical protein
MRRTLTMGSLGALLAALAGADAAYQPRQRAFDCKVCAKGWQMATGEKPTRFFER